MSQALLNWDHFNLLLAQHELSSFAYACLKNYSALLPVPEIDLLRKNHYFILARLADLEKEFLMLADIFQGQKVDLLPLKGAAFLIDQIYGDKFGLRPMVDMDILVKKENLFQAEKLIVALGYRKQLCGFKEDYWRRKSYHIIFTKEKNGKICFHLEMHWLLDYPRKRLLLPLLWDRIRKLQVGDKQIALLSVEDTLFCLALHLRRFGNVLSLKSACDFACLLTKYKDLDWDYILQEANQGEMRTSLYFRLIQASVFFDIQVPNLILNNLSPAIYKQRVIKNFIANDTFLDLDKMAKSLFLKNHFVVYDNFWEPADMIINMPVEQFAKFYRLAPYSPGTYFLYCLRFLYFPLHLLMQILKVIERKIVARLALSIESKAI